MTDLYMSHRRAIFSVVVALSEGSVLVVLVLIHAVIGLHRGIRALLVRAQVAVVHQVHEALGLSIAVLGIHRPLERLGSCVS
jgi:hypothetical protein